MKSHAIRTARVPARLSHRRMTRPTLERWLAEADPARHGLPAQAIVLVRRLQASWTALADPEPRTRHGVLASALAGAARPARGERHGDVVWFADEAELLACLARAVLAGELALHWWWKLVLRELAPAAARARWLESMQVAPRALARLEPAAASRWLATWTPSEQRRLVRELARVFPLAEEAVLAEMAEADAGTPSEAHGPAWVDLPAACVAAGATPASEGLLRLLLAVAREPMAAHDARRVRAIWHRVAPGVVSRPAPGAVHTEPVATAAIAWREHEAVMAALPKTGPATTVATAAAARTPPSPGAEVSALRPIAEHAAPALVAADDADEAVTPASAAMPGHRPVAIAPPIFLDTAFGGLLFLLNAALQLGLYGDFTQPRRPRTLDCSPWRFLLASGRLYAGRAFAGDLLAAWLRARAPEPPPGVRTRHPGLWRTLRERLALALSLDDPNELVTLLLRLPGRIADGGERIDVHMELAALPLPVRLAGLDRDPGWIPAAGCDIRFHFH